MTQYPGPDPDDPFSRPPNEQGSEPAQPGTEETAPVQGYEPPQPETPQNPWAGYGQPTTPYQQGPQQPYQQPGYQQPGQPPYAPGYGQPGYPQYTAPPNHPQATTALVLGLVGLIGGCLCVGLPLLVAPFAWVVGAKAKREIAASHGQLGGEGSAQAGFIMGIIGTALLILVVLAIGFLVVVGIASGGSSATTTTF